MTDHGGEAGIRDQLITELQTLHNDAGDDKEKIERLGSIIVVSRHINQGLLRATNETELFQQVCDLLNILEDIEFVWIGVVDDGSFEVRPIASAGVDREYLSSVRVAWDESEYGAGPMGRAIRTGRPSIVPDIARVEQEGLWKAEALKRAYACNVVLPLTHGGDVIGALSVFSDRVNAFEDFDVKFLMEVAGDIALGVKSLRLEKELTESLASVHKSLNKTVEAIALLGEMRDPYTSGHQQRVAQLACAISEEMGLAEWQTDGIHVAALLHDIGKIAIPVDILNKVGEISDNEFGIIKTHPTLAYEVLKGIEFPWPVAEAVFQHHERLDGGGYPEGVSGEDLILEARILGVADATEAMASHRPYRPALGTDKALLEILQGRGAQYDPAVVDACLTLFQNKEFEFGEKRRTAN